MDTESGDLFQSFSVKGDWWLPDKEDISIPGDLTFDKSEGLVLVLRGFFGDGVPAYDSYSTQPTIILGDSSEGPLTLYQTYLTGWSMSGSGKYETTFTALYLFFGTHFVNENEMIFETMRISFSNLESWVNEKAYRLKPIEKETITKREASWSIPDSEEVRIESIGSFLRIEPNIPSESYGSFSLKWNFRVGISGHTSHWHRTDRRTSCGIGNIY